MNPVDKLPELAEITDAGLRGFVEGVLARAPVYFWSVPASTTGRFHPPDEWLPGGLVLHTRRVARVALEIARGWKLSYEQKNILVAAALLHDVCKYGPGPRERGELYGEHCEAGSRLVLSVPAADGIPRQLIAGLVYHHMGPFGPGAWTPEERTPLELALFTSDYLAARPDLFANGTGRRSWGGRK